MNDTPSQIAFNEHAPESERYDAQAELQRSSLADLIPSPEIQPVIDYIVEDLHAQEMTKALMKPNVIPFQNFQGWFPRHAIRVSR